VQGKIVEYDVNGSIGISMFSTIPLTTTIFRASGISIG